jgi:two-component system, NtrC family, response regulator AtoC
MRILLVDDDQPGRELLADFLEEQLGHEVTQCENGHEAFAAFEKSPFPLVITDIQMPVMDGMQLLKRLKATDEGSQSDVVLITGFGDMNSAVQALRSDAYDYLAKPVNLQELEAVVAKIAEHQSLLKENEELTRHFKQKVNEATRMTRSRLDSLQKAYADVVGVGDVGVFSDKMREVLSLAERFHHDRSVPVLIQGETGTGKDVAARMVHYGPGDVLVTSPFVSINCAAISANLFESELFGYEGGAFSGAKRSGQPGKLEMAEGGSVFLDEIGELSLEIQPKLLHVLEKREFYRVGGVKKIKLDARIICATNRNLLHEVREGAFRQDLFFRLNVAKIELPPMRERRQELEPLAAMFLTKIAGQKKSRFASFSADAVKILEAHPWPGNVRELINTIERVVLLYDDTVVRPEHLAFLAAENVFASDGMAAADEGDGLRIEFPEDKLSMKEVEMRVIRKAMEKFGDNKSRVATYLGLSRNTLINKLKD